MTVTTLLALSLYLAILGAIAYFSYEKQKRSKDFFVGDRKLNFYVTALSAHASDMSSWIFMAFPGIVYTSGLVNLSTAIGLFVFMFLNWQFIAPKLREETEKLNALTLSDYFQKKLGDTKGIISVLTAIFSFVFYLYYICSGLIGMGLLFETLFSIPYHTGLLIGIFVATIYVMLGGFTTIAWTDFFQGSFLLIALIATPLIAWLQNPELSFDLPSYSLGASTWFDSLLLLFGWGLGYFGQPHILIKFMGIEKPSELTRSKYLGMSWLFLSLSASFTVGAIARSFFNAPLENSNLVYVLMTKAVLHPFAAAFVLCGVLAAIISTMNAQILVLSSNFSQDIYKSLFHKSASDKQVVWVARASIVCIGIFAYIIAYFQVSSIYDLVLFAWSGIGITFGPLLIACLYFRNVNLKAAIASLFFGVAIVIGLSMSSSIAPLLPAFMVSLLILRSFSSISS